MVKGLLIYTVWERWQVAHIKQVLLVEIVIQIFKGRLVLSEIASLKRILKHFDFFSRDAHCENLSRHMREHVGQYVEKKG